MVTMRQVRNYALSLPETAEQPHHEISSFRVRDQIFATVPDDAHVRVMATEEEILAACAEQPDVCRPIYWGRRLACVEVTLSGASMPLIRLLVEDAWARKVPDRRRRRHRR